MTDLFGDPNAVTISAVPGYLVESGCWVVQLAIGVTPFWQVNFPTMTDRDISWEERLELRKDALEMFAEKLKSKLLAD